MKVTELELALKDLVETEGINAGAVVTRNGIMVGFYLHAPVEVSTLSAVVAMMTRTAEKCTRMFRKGEMEEIITKADSGMLLTEKYGGFILVVAADKSFDFESIKSKREKVKAAIRSIA